MRRKVDASQLLESLHDAVVVDLHLQGPDLVLDIRLVVDWVPDPDSPGLPERPEAQAYRLVSRPYHLVFEGFEGPHPWGLIGRSLEFVEEKDGAYLLVTEALEEYVVSARGLRLEPDSPAREDCPMKHGGMKP